MEWAEEK
jgi:hypothetical protein